MSCYGNANIKKTLYAQRNNVLQKQKPMISIFISHNLLSTRKKN